MMEQTVSGQWLSLVDYSAKKSVSLSTLRRYIKAKKIPFRFEQGKYLILDDGKSMHIEAEPTISFKFEQVDTKNVLNDLEKAKQEIAELKMLVAIYEENLQNR